MQELRLMGVHEDGDHLLFGDDSGAMYKVRIDETLRVATQRVPRRQARQSPAVKVPLSPREIQSRIRAGASAEQIAVESGYDLDHIRRYEAPVRAERDWMASQARLVEVASPSHHEEYRAAFGDRPAVLEAMVAVRLRGLSVDPATVAWDAWRRADGLWDVVARFDLPEESAIDLGEQPPAQWLFDPSGKRLTNANRWAQVLSELEPISGPIPARRLSAVTDTVFDVESEPEVDDESDDLLDVLRSRRGQRIGADEESDDALALLLSQGPVPSAHPRSPSSESTDPAGDAPHFDEDGQPVPDQQIAGSDSDSDGNDSSDDATSTPGTDASTDSPSREGHRWGSGRSRLRGRNRRGASEAENVSVDDLLGFDRDPGAEAGAGAGRASSAAAATGSDDDVASTTARSATAEAREASSDAMTDASTDGEPADVTSEDGTTESESTASENTESGATPGARSGFKDRSAAGRDSGVADDTGDDAPAAATAQSGSAHQTGRTGPSASRRDRGTPRGIGSGRDAASAAAAGSGASDRAGTDGGADATTGDTAPAGKQKAKRSSVPSWDDIVFGKRGD